MQRKRKGKETLAMSPGEDRWLLLIRQPNNHPFRPPTDVCELADKLIVLVEIAGIRTSDFTITLLERQLVITGMRVHPQHSKPAYHQVEIGYGEFRVEVALPWPVERDEVTASYEAGFLQVELPRKVVQQIPVVNISNVE